MESVQATTEDYQAKMKSAEAYEAHGLYNEALELYKEILDGDAGLGEDAIQQIKFKVNELGKEIEDKDNERRCANCGRRCMAARN